MNKDDNIAKHVDFLVRSFARQVAEGRLRCFVFPPPTNSAEFEAVYLFVAVIEEKTGQPVQLDLTPGSHLALVLPSRLQAANDGH